MFSRSQELAPEQDPPNTQPSSAAELNREDPYLSQQLDEQYDNVSESDENREVEKKKPRVSKEDMGESVISEFISVHTNFSSPSKKENTDDIFGRQQEAGEQQISVREQSVLIDTFNATAASQQPHQQPGKPFRK